MSHSLSHTKPAGSRVHDARALRSREALRQALLRLLEKKSFDEISIRDITAAADVGYRTFFRHHATKESLLHDIAAEQIQRLLVLALPIVVAGNNRAGSTALCTYVHQHRKLWATLLTGGAAATMREEFLRIARDIGPKEPPPGMWLPPDVGTILAISSTIELLAWWLRQKKPLPIARIAEIHDRMIVTPVINSDKSGAWRTTDGTTNTRSQALQSKRRTKRSTTR
jgi:AcrR family transcriptional regulator